MIKLRRLWVKAKKICHYCGVLTTLERGKLTSATRDHVVPRALGGANHYSNIVLACASCNNARGWCPYGVFTQRYQPARGPAMYEAFLRAGHAG